MSDDLNLMRGFPPPESAQVDLTNWRNPPFNRWAFHHLPQIVPCAPVWPGPAGHMAWKEAPEDVGRIAFDWKGAKTTVSDMLRDTSTDGFIVLRDGCLVHASYDAGLSPHVPHILFSVTKSVVGLAAGILAVDGGLQVEREITHYLPELSDSGYAGATVRQLLDMTVGVKFDEDYLAPSSDMARYREASGWNVGDPRDAMGLRKFVATIPAPFTHGPVFRYCSPNTDLLAWVLERVSGQALADFLSAHLWSPLGARDVAFLAVDGFGAPRGSGGLCTTVRDLARLGELVLNGGALGAKQIVPEQWIAEFCAGGDSAAWAAGSFADGLPETTYRSGWYRYGSEDWAVGGFGIYGQALYIHPASRTVFAKLSSYPVPLDFERENMQRAAFRAIARALAG